MFSLWLHWKLPFEYSNDVLVDMLLLVGVRQRISLLELDAVLASCLFDMRGGLMTESSVDLHSVLR